MKRVILTAVMCALFATLYANKTSDEIKAIMKNTSEYISVESTSPNEHEAYVNALRQITDIARNYVDANNDGKPITDAAIESAVSKIVTTKGDFTRVFLYARRSDLINLSDVQQENEPANVPSAAPEDNATIPVDDDNDDMPAPDTVETADDYIPDDSFEENLPDEIVETVNDNIEVSSRMKDMIDLIQKSRSLKNAADVVYKYIGRNLVSEYGAARNVENSAASFWVVENRDGDITVLGPEIRGHRHNFRTGKVDALHRYSRGFWFRTR